MNSKINSIARIVFILALSLSLITKVIAETEPNNSFGQANSISLNTSQNGYLDESDDIDWFRIEVSVDGRLTISDQTTSNLDYLLNLYETDGETLITSIRRYTDNSGGTLSVSLSPGVYYILFDRYSFYSSGTYEFTAQYETVAKSGDNEPNDLAENAQIISLNEETSANLGNRKIRLYDDYDWYKFTVSNDGRLTILDTTSSTLDYIMNLYEEDGSTLITTIRRYMDNSGGTLSVSLMPGDYYLRFDKYSFDFSTYGEYYFTPQFIEVSRPGDVEPNDSVEDAQIVPLNESISANLGNRKIGLYDDYDWYKFTVTNDGRLTVLDTTSFTLDYIMNLYEADGTTFITTIRRYMDNSGGTLSVNLMPGDYYLRFDKYSFDFSTYGEYYFTLQFIEVSRPGDAEPNDSVEDAQIVPLNESISANLGNRKIGLYDDLDRYKFTVPTDGRLTILDTTTSKLDYLLYLFEADGETSITSIRRYTDNSGGTLSVSLLPGDYYLRFDKYSFDFSTYGEYYFTPQFIESSLPGDEESNDSLNNAQLMKVDTINTGNLGHRKIGRYDDIDWWKINFPEDGFLTLLDTNETTLDYLIKMYDATDTSLYKQTRRYHDGSGSTIAASVDSGMYFIQFDKYSFDFSTYGSYSVFPDFLPKPKADFSFAQTVSSFLFSNKTSEGETYEWSFDDGNTSVEVNPHHTYEEPGEYNVCLIASNQAGSDTVCKYVTIFGLQKIIDNVGGNTGDVSIDIYGGGFTPESRVKFTRNGYDDIVADTVVNLKRGVLTALFNLRGAEIGLWDVVVETPGLPTITEEEGFTIVQGTAAEPWVEIIGRNRALIGRWQTYTISYGNKGNVDASGVPLWFAVSNNEDLEIKFVDFEITPPPYAVDSLGLGDILRDSIPIYFESDTLFGEPFNCKVYPLIIPVVPAGQTGQLTIKVKSMENFEIQAWVNPPIFESPMSQELKDCIFWAQMKAIGDGIISIAGDLIPAGGCINAVVTNYIYNPWSYPKPGDDKPKSISSHLWTLASTVINCAGDIPIFKAYKLTVSIFQLGAAIIDNSIADKECREAFGNNSTRTINVRTVTSFDPNEKTGPEGYTDNNYILKTPTINYTVYFENKDTAKAPAQEILIVDSLDLNSFDIEEFNFKSITIADTTINILAGLTEFAIDIDMRPEMEIITRATGNIDTISGVVTWLFKALDPETMDDNENPDLGVLLPNVVSPQGEGNVGFNIGLKPEIGHGDILTNKAVITFDFNKPITTNEFISIIDSESPQSSMQIANQDDAQNSITFSLDGTDSGSGIGLYTVYASINDSAYVPVLRSIEQQATYTPKISGNYKFYSIATDKLGNIETVPVNYDAEANITVSSNKVIVTENDIEIWPNPTNGNLNLNPGKFYGEDLTIELKTITGQLIKSEQIPGGTDTTIKLDFKGIPKNVYLLHVKAGKKEAVRKIALY